MDIKDLKVFKNCNGEIVITSLIIAEETCQEHWKVMQDIKKWVPTFKVGTYKDVQNKERPCIELDKYQFMLYAMHKKGYDDWKQQIVEEYKTMEQYIIKTNQIDRFNKFRKQEKHDTRDFYEFIGHEGKCVALSKCLYNIVSYKFNLPFKHNKEQIVALAQYNINEEVYEFYLQMKTDAEKFIGTFMALDEEHFMKNTMDLLCKKYVDDMDNFNKYCLEHIENDLSFKIDIKEHLGKGFGYQTIFIPKNE